MKLKGKVAIVTGGAQGVGKAIALAFAREGAHLVLASRTLSTVQAAARDMQAAGRRVLAIQADVSQRQEVEAMVAAVLAEFGRIDVLVNNAAVQPPIGPLWENDPDEWLKTVHINLGGGFLCCRAVIPVMIRQGGGKIINLSGGGAASPRPFFSAYACSKAGLVRFTETLAEELKAYNIQVNAIAPGMVATRMIHEILAAGTVAGDEELALAREMVQKGDGPVVQKATDLAVFLACQECDGLTGRLISAVWDEWERWQEKLISLPPEAGTLRRVPLGLPEGDGSPGQGQPAYRGFPGQTDPDASARAATILNILRGKKASRFLDIGCGDGQITARVGEAVNAEEIHGVDVAPEAVQQARERGVWAVQVDLDRQPLPYSSNYFDLLLATEVLEHVYDPGSLLAEAHRVLVPGGQFIVTTPNLASWYNRLALLLGFQPWLTAASLYDPEAGKLRVGKFLTKVGTIGGDHLRVVTLKALRSMALAHGFVPVKFYTVSPVRLFDARPPTMLEVPLLLLQKTLGRFSSLSSTLVAQLVAEKRERGGPMYRRGVGTRNPYAPLAQAVATSGIFRFPMGRATLGERLEKVCGAAISATFRLLSPWWESRFVNALRAIVPPAPLRMLALQSWEPETTRLFQRLLHPGMTVVDAGAQIGYYTVLSAMAVGPAGHVYAFEPDPDSLPLLRRNVRLGGYEGFVTVVPMALSNGLGQVELFLGKGKDVTSIYRTRDSGKGSATVDNGSATVETISLDGYFAGLGWPAVDLMKMDIEGAEILALKGMVELAQRNPHLKLIIEFCPSHIRDAGRTPEEFFQALRQVGFTRVWVASDKLKPVRVPQDLPWLIEMGDRSTVNLLCERGED